jgi:hypothetical protein
MASLDRRDRVALDEAYTYYKTTVVSDGQSDLLTIVNALKTVSHALHAPQNGSFKLTTRLWLRIEQALFDKLVTGFAAHLVILDNEGRALAAGDELSEDCLIELHPEGLRRADDVFRMPFADLPSFTQMQLTTIWKEKGPNIKREDFSNGAGCSASGICAMKPFAVAHEILEKEAQFGKQLAYQQWWELYWQAYCTRNKREKQMLIKDMSSLEAVWGDLYY